MSSRVQCTTTYGINGINSCTCEHEGNKTGDVEQIYLKTRGSKQGTVGGQANRIDRAEAVFHLYGQHGDELSNEQRNGDQRNEGSKKYCQATQELKERHQPGGDMWERHTCIDQ